MKHHRSIALAVAAAAVLVLAVCRGRIYPVDGKQEALARPAAQETVKDDETVGEGFHRETGLSLSGGLADAFSKKPKKPAATKTYEGAKKVKLPDPEYSGKTVEQALETRRSVRSYSDEPLALKQLSQLLFAAQGITSGSSGHALRTAPSAGALYPFEVYAVVNGVMGLERGIYHYAPVDHALELVKEGDFREKISDAGLGQSSLAEAGVVLALTAVFDRTRSKYGERGFRYVYMESGHIAQNVFLQSVSLGLGCVCVGAFYDDDLNALLGVDGIREAAVYLEAIGSP